MYGVNGAEDRIFVSGNSDNQNFDYRSYVQNLSYFPSENYTRVGLDSSPIMGYSRMADGRLAVHKARSNGLDSTIFYRTSSLVNGEAIFPLENGAKGVGVESKYALATLINEPLILSNQGVFAIVPVNNSAVNEKYAVQRSYYINNKLLSENLSEAVGKEFNGKYYLSVNNQCFVADSRYKSYENKAESSTFQYEWWYWNNIPARVWFESNNRLYFGTEDGRICLFKTKGEINLYKDDDDIVSCYWETPILAFGSTTNVKTIKFMTIALNPYTRSSIKFGTILKSLKKQRKQFNTNTFNFEDIDFEEFTFETDGFPRVIPIRTKFKKFMFIQFYFESTEEKALGTHKLSIQYTVNNKYKGR